MSQTIGSTPTSFGNSRSPGTAAQPSPTGTRSSRSTTRPTPSDSVPFVPWDELYRKLSTPGPDEFSQGDHVAIIGPTGGGKTHIALQLADLRTYVLFVACKPEDPLIQELSAKGYHLTAKMEVPYTEHNGSYKPVYNKVVYWPRLPREAVRKLQASDLLRAEKRMQKPAVAAALGYVRRNGRWCLILDEGTWVCRDLSLQRDVDSALFQFRTLKASIIICGQRPSWMGRYALSSPTHLFLFGTNDAQDRKALGDISGVDGKMVAEVVRTLDFRSFEVCYVNTRTREICTTIAPAK